MTQKSRATLNSDADTNLADNTTGDISPSDVRTIIKDLADSAYIKDDEVLTSYETEIALLNMALADALNVAQFIGDTGNRYADSFDALTYIDNAGATNLDVSEAGVLKPTSAVGTDQTATHTGYTTSGNTVSASTDSATVEAWKAFDKLTGNVSAENTWQATTTTGYIQYQFGSAQTIASYTILAQATATGGAAAPNTWTLEGSNTGSFSGEEVTLDTQSSVTWSNAEEKSFTISSPASYAYYRIDVTANNGHSILGIDEIELVSQGATNNMTVKTTGLSAASAPSTMRAYLTIEEIDSVTLNTDLTAELSRDNGTTWATATLSELFTVGSNAVLDTGEVDVSGQPSGTTPVLRIKTLNNKSVKVHAHYVYWS